MVLSCPDGPVFDVRRDLLQDAEQKHSQDIAGDEGADAAVQHGQRDGQRGAL